MVDCTRNGGGMTVGLDLGDKYSSILVLGANGEELDEGRVRTTPEALRLRFSALPPSRVAIEVGTHSPWVAALLEECKHEVLVANARRLRLIYENERKSDKVDAENLARLARVDPMLLYPIKHRGPELRADLALMGMRDTLVRARSMLITTIRGTVKSSGSRLRSSSAEAFPGKVVEGIPEELKEAVTPATELIEALTVKIREYDRKIEELCETKYPQTKRLRQVKGVGPVTALAFVLIVGDPRRFKKSRDVGAYLGLVPRRQESGAQQPQLRITKAGDRYMRRLLVGSAHYILGPFGEDCDLRRQGQELARRGGKNAKKRAVVAVARKLSVLLHRLWVNGEEYEPLRNKKRRSGCKAKATVTTA